MHIRDWSRPFGSVQPRRLVGLTISPRPQMSEGSLFIGRFCFEIRHITFRYGKPQDYLPADFVLGTCQSDVAQVKAVQGRANHDVDRIDGWGYIWSNSECPCTRTVRARHALTPS
jgi:hypothetical protein